MSRLAEVCGVLNREGAAYVLVGTRALQLWGSRRAACDIEILIEPTGANAGRVLRALGQLGFRLAQEWMAEAVAQRPVTIIGAMPRVHVLTVAWTVPYGGVAPQARHFDLEGVTIPAASIDALIASKRTGWPGDAADIVLLEEIRRLGANSGR